MDRTESRLLTWQHLPTVGQHHEEMKLTMEWEGARSSDEESSGEAEEKWTSSEEEGEVLSFGNNAKSLTVRSYTTSEELEGELARLEGADAKLAALQTVDCYLTEFAFLDKCVRLNDLNMNSNGAFASAVFQRGRVRMVLIRFLSQS